MKLIIIVLIVLVNIVNFGECDPATLCKWWSCYWSVFSTKPECELVYQLRIRDRYEGWIVSDKCTDTDECIMYYYQRRCSDDQIYCVEAYRRSDNFILRHANLDRFIPASSGHVEDAEDWCKIQRKGTAFWMDL